MRRLLYSVLLMTVVVPLSECRAEYYVDSQVVCQLIQGANADTVAASIDAEIIDGIDSFGLYLFGYSQSLPVDTIIQLLNARPDVSYAQPNYVVKIDLSQIGFPEDQTNQPFVDGVEPLEYYGQYAQENLMIDSAHILQDGEAAVVAVIDGGLDNRQPLFAGRLHSAFYDFVDFDCSPWVFSGLIAHHGTFVSGVVVRSAPRAKLMIIRCFSSAGNSTSFKIAQGIYHAADNGADVINMSFSMAEGDDAISEAIYYANLNKGVVLTASAGNDGIDYDCFPGSHPLVMNVAAVDTADIIADFSNYGLSISVTAPGTRIFSSLCGVNEWGTWSGTSFASPFTAGLAALVKSAYPDSTAEFVMERIVQTAIDIDYLNPSYEYFIGSGRINFLYAVFIPGDANGDGSVNLGDVVHTINYVFRNGPPSIPSEAGDNNGDSETNVADAVYLIKYIFGDGPPPVAE